MALISIMFHIFFKDSVIMALKSEEVEGKVATYITVLTTDNKVLLPETKFADAKFEGLEFVWHCLETDIEGLLYIAV